MPDESRLNVASIQMAPFEILGGAHPPDVRRGSRRFFQYDYQLRIISRDAIGQDVNVPPLTISYRVHSRVGAAAKLEGRDLSYVLPAMPIRVLSLVPADATDIRDASEASLATVDAWRSRSRRFELLALALGALAARDDRARAGAAGAARAIDDERRSRADSRSRGPDARGRRTDRRAGARHARRLDRRHRSRRRSPRFASWPRRPSVEPSVSGRCPRTAWCPRAGCSCALEPLRPAAVTVSSPVTPDEVGRSAVRNAPSMTLTRGHQLEGLQSGLARSHRRPLSPVAVARGRGAGRGGASRDQRGHGSGRRAQLVERPSPRLGAQACDGNGRARSPPTSRPNGGPSIWRACSSGSATPRNSC